MRNRALGLRLGNVSEAALGEIFPLLIDRGDQSDFFRTQPALDLFFARNSCSNIAEFFEVDKFVKIVLLREPGNEF